MPTLVILDILTVVVLFVSKVVTQVVVWFGGCFCCCFSFVSFLFFFEDDHEVRQVPMRYTVSLYYIRVKSGLMISGDTPLNGTKVAYAIIAMLIILIKNFLAFECFFMCCLRLPEWALEKMHCGYSYGYFPVWIQRCLRLYERPHSLYWCVFSPMWMSRCWVSCDCRIEEKLYHLHFFY